jgi:hypothetical protein
MQCVRSSELKLIGTHLSPKPVIERKCGVKRGSVRYHFSRTSISRYFRYLKENGRYFMKTVTARDLQKNVKEWVGGLRQDQTLVTGQGKPAAVSVAIEGSDSRELMSIASPPATARDLRLDFFRGLALFCIFIDHIPNNILAKFTLQSLMFADAAEVFILISGYTAGMVYGRAMERQGFLIAAVRIYHRVWQLYVAHIFLFMIFMATMAYTAGVLNTSLYAEEFGAANFLNEPGLAVVKALTLQFQPAFMDILPLYIVLLAVLPLVVAGYRSWPSVVLFVSMSVWLAVQIDKRIALPAYPGPDQVWFFNPFAWQALFFLGAWFFFWWGSLSVRPPPAVEFPGSTVAGCSTSQRASRWPDS